MTLRPRLEPLLHKILAAAALNLGVEDPLLNQILTRLEAYDNAVRFWEDVFTVLNAGATAMGTDPNITIRGGRREVAEELQVRVF